MSITFEQAVTQLQAMFPALQPDLIVTVLESNGGQMQHTVSALLQLDPGTSSSAAAPADETSGAASAAASSAALTPAPPAPPAPPARPAQPAAAPRRRPTPQARGAAPAARSRGRWRNPLPDDFLRVPGRHRAPVTSTPEDIVQQDAVLAQMMHNELFLDELRRHPEFADYLEAEEEFFHQQQYAASLAAGERVERSRARGRRAQPEGPSLSDKVSAMGGEMRRKFNAFAMRFAARFGSKGGEEAKSNSESRGLLGAESGSDDEEPIVRRSSDGPRSRGALAMGGPRPGNELAPARDSRAKAD